MSLIVLLIVLLARAVLSAHQNLPSCLVKFTEQGCYHDNSFTIDEKEWNVNRTAGDVELTGGFLQNISCACAERAAKKGYKAFGIKVEYVKGRNVNASTPRPNCTAHVALDNNHMISVRNISTSSCEPHLDTACCEVDWKSSVANAAAADHWIQIHFNSKQTIKEIVTPNEIKILHYSCNGSNQTSTLTKKSTYKDIHWKPDHGNVCEKASVIQVYIGFQNNKPFDTTIWFYAETPSNSQTAEVSVSSGKFGNVWWNPSLDHFSVWWSPYVNKWLQVDFGVVTNITAISTQKIGDGYNWNTFKLSHSNDGKNFTKYQLNKIFYQNVKIEELKPPMIARYVRIHPHPADSYYVISMSVKFYGYTSGLTLAWRCSLYNSKGENIKESTVNDRKCTWESFEDCAKTTSYCTGYDGSTFVYNIAEEKKCLSRYSTLLDKSTTKITGLMLRTAKAYSELHCADTCFRSHHCDSYGFQPTSGQCKMMKDLSGIDDKPPGEQPIEGYPFKREHFHEVMFGNPSQNQFCDAN